MPNGTDRLRYSTVEHLNLERQLVERAMDARGSGVGIASEKVVASVVRTRPTLSDEQRRVVESLCLDGHGVAVVSDKPFGADAQQAAALIAAAEHQKVPLSVYQNRRWDSDFLTVRKLLEAGALGQVTRFESRIER